MRYADGAVAGKSTDCCISHGAEPEDCTASRQHTRVRMNGRQHTSAASTHIRTAVDFLPRALTTLFLTFLGILQIRL